MNFDLSNVKSNTGNVLPSGKYETYLVEASLKDTKTGGKMIAAQFKIPSGEFANRVIFHNFNVENANQKATEIGLGQLKSLLECSGYATPDNLISVEDLVGLRVGVKTRVGKDTGYGEKAEISYFYKLDGATPTQAEENLPF